MTSRDRLLESYPNIENNELPMLIGCLSETTIDNAEKYFLRYCYKDVIIHEIVPWKQNCQPSCIWRVMYKLKDRTSDYVEAGRTVEDYSVPLPADEELKKLFANITAMSCGVTVAHKGYTFDRAYALVDYVPICCVCPVEDFSETAKLISRMRSSVTELLECEIKFLYTI